MSIWTPSGERPIGRTDPGAGTAPPTGTAPPGGMPSAGAVPPAGDEALDDEELAAKVAEVQRQLVETPASVVVANHCIGLFQLAVLHLNEEPPKLPEAQLAIDAMAAVVETLGTRLGEEEQPLKEALTQLRLGFVQVKSRAGGGG
jgi:hypothetical protein